MGVGGGQKGGGCMCECIHVTATALYRRVQYIHTTHSTNLREGCVGKEKTG
jgi:hypothetical protein